MGGGRCRPGWLPRRCSQPRCSSTGRWRRNCAAHGANSFADPRFGCFRWRFRPAPPQWWFRADRRRPVPSSLAPLRPPAWSRPAALPSAPAAPAQPVRPQERARRFRRPPPQARLPRRQQQHRQRRRGARLRCLCLRARRWLSAAWQRWAARLFQAPRIPRAQHRRRHALLQQARRQGWRGGPPAARQSALCLPPRPCGSARPSLEPRHRPPLRRSRGRGSRPGLPRACLDRRCRPRHRARGCTSPPPRWRPPQPRRWPLRPRRRAC
mmetsp:Transcript_108500/g.312561  ORF Transcript_108500/g.312561 Transcript_108500/m.312561 type:complete len:267 (-) Transcript_108500:550-1350(-)